MIPDSVAGGNVLPFGRYQGQPLETIPDSYLSWLLTSCKLSTGLRRTVADELRRRGGSPPPPPTPPAPPTCQRCGPVQGKPRYRWLDLRDGRRQIRRECRTCSLSLGFAPQVEPFVSLANAAAAGRAAG